MKKSSKFKIIVILFLTSLVLSGCAKNDTVKINNHESLLIAHRGLSGLEVENTDAAFIAAGERSYYGIEADVRRTSDGRFIICHDADLERVGGEKIDVEASTLEALLNCDLLNKNGESDSSVHLSTLEGYISICKKYDKQAILELKSDFRREEIGEIIDIIASLEYLERVTFISFSYDNLLYVREFLPDQSCMYLFSKMSDDIVEMLIRDRIDVAIKHTKLKKRDLDAFHAAGLKVNCWTVDSKHAAEKYAKWGVDYITTNILE